MINQKNLYMADRMLNECKKVSEELKVLFRGRSASKTLTSLSSIKSLPCGQAYLNFIVLVNDEEERDYCIPCVE